MTTIVAPLRVHWLRHGRVASHRGDTPLTSEGLQEVEEAGKRLSGMLVPGEVVSLLHAPTRRTEETAQALSRSIAQALDASVQICLRKPQMNLAIRNPDLYVAGIRVDMVSSADALAEQLPSSDLDAQDLEKLPFWNGFWSQRDRIGYWVSLVNPPGEDANIVARRLFTFAQSLLDQPRQQPRRYICVTHSPLLRAFLRYYLLGYDPGEPDYCETIDMEFADAGKLTIQYRDTRKEIVLA
jgi:broad specificity phosphatase PhoE